MYGKLVRSINNFVEVNEQFAQKLYIAMMIQAHMFDAGFEPLSDTDLKLVVDATYAYYCKMCADDEITLEHVIQGTIQYVDEGNGEVTVALEEINKYLEGIVI